ncbi:hypothetical protein C8Q79DRAFT_900519 [Trametes meyenii]|nr:hypothetical protein C8Q79DRAFT_900519 [Trametes meyenii]
MTSTLEDGIVSGSTAARASLERKQDILHTEEADIAESRVRYEAERLLNFYDDLSSHKIAEEVVALILRFKRVENSVGEATSRALQAVSLPLDDTTHISQYTQLLDTLDLLETECQRLGMHIRSIALDIPTDGSKLSPLLISLAEILRGHEDNVQCAKSVVQSCKETYRMGIGTLTLG